MHVNRPGALRVCAGSALIVSLIASGVACARTSGPSDPTGRIVVFGDSLATSPARDRAFPAVLQQRLTQAGQPWTVINLSVPGETTARGRTRFGAALAEEPDLLLLELGANDGLRGVDLDDVRENLSEMIRRAQARDVRVLLCAMETLPVYGLRYTLDFHDLFPDLARDHGVTLVPFLLNGVAGNRELNGADLIHPNEEGARRIADNVWPSIQDGVRSVLGVRSLLLAR